MELGANIHRHTIAIRLAAMQEPIRLEAELIHLITLPKQDTNQPPTILTVS